MRALLWLALVALALAYGSRLPTAADLMTPAELATVTAHRAAYGTPNP